EFLPSTGIADTSFWGPEIEFYIFNSLRFDQAQNFGYYYIDSEEGIWNSGQNGTPNLAHRPRYKEGYFPVPPADKLQDIRSTMARHYIGGLLKHAPAILAFAAPTTNSYRRLVPGYEAPINLVYSMRNRSACVRIPTYFDKPEARRLEFRAPDPSCNPYLSFSACLMAGLDGVINQIEPPAPMDVDLYELEGE